MPTLDQETLRAYLAYQARVLGRGEIRGWRLPPWYALPTR